MKPKTILIGGASITIMWWVWTGIFYLMEVL